MVIESFSSILFGDDGRGLDLSRALDCSKSPFSPNSGLDYYLPVKELLKVYDDLFYMQKKKEVLLVNIKPKHTLA